MTIIPITSASGSSRLRLGVAALLAATPLVLAVPAPASAAPAVATVTATSVSPSTISSGQEAIQRVTLSAPAPAGGTIVKLRDLNLYEDRNYVKSTGRQVTVPEGRRSVSFPIRVQSERHQTTTRLQASVGDSTAETAITVEPVDWRVQEVTDFWIKEQHGNKVALTGTSVTGTVKLKAPAPVGGLAVDIRPMPIWSGTTYAPSYVIVPAGDTSATFPIRITAERKPRIGDMQADLGSNERQAVVTGVPKSFAVGPIRKIRNTQGAWRNRAAVGVGNHWHPFGAVVKLTSDTPGVRVPSQVEITSEDVGTLFTISVDPSVPIGTKAKITAEWVFGPSAPVTTEITIES